MRSGLFLLSGLLLLSGSIVLAKLFAENFPSSGTVVTIVFILVWLGLTGFNMWVGVAKAGYSAKEELPVLLLLFGVPAAVAVLARWKFL
jgi:hypothetical protein